MPPYEELICDRGIYNSENWQPELCDECQSKYQCARWKWEKYADSRERALAREELAKHPWHEPTYARLWVLALNIRANEVWGRLRRLSTEELIALRDEREERNAQLAELRRMGEIKDIYIRQP